LINLNNLVVNIIYSKITLGDETIDRDIKRAFGKIELILK
jgi:hypothetical protein